MEMKIDVLDKGYVRYVGHMGTDETVIEAARMSTGKGFVSWDNYDECSKCGVVHIDIEHIDLCEKDNQPHKFVVKRDSDLLDFMYRHQHMTPFEMCELALEVYAPIMVFREWHRHRTQSVNEFSGRYSTMPDVHYVPDASRFERKSSTNKQEASKMEAFDLREATGATSETMRAAVAQDQHDVYQHYTHMLDCGVPKEVARINTPVSRYSKMRVKTDLRNWLGFLNLRMRPNAQWEIVQYANAVSEVIKAHWPRTYALFEEYDLYGVKLSRSEIRAIRATMLVEGDPNWVRIETDEQAKTLGMSASRRREFLTKMDDGGEKIL